jgi:uncharacterized protein YndB with AHSA1/START domain
MTATANARVEDHANDRLGTVTGPREVTFVRLLPGPIERVWSFIVDGEKRKLWLCAGEMEPREGGRVTLAFNNSSITPPGEPIPESRKKHAGAFESHGRVIRWQPPRGLTFSWWGEPGETSEVQIDIEEVEGRVRLTLVHRLLKDRAGMLGVSGGWHAHLGVLADALEGRAPQRFWTVIEEVEPIYDRAIPPE